MHGVRKRIFRFIDSYIQPNVDLNENSACLSGEEDDSSVDGANPAEAGLMNTDVIHI
jgi:hypothetical protein